MEVIRINHKLNMDELEKVILSLKSGGLVIYPTETAYGIGASVGSKAGVEKLMRYKGKREGKPISVAVAARKMAEEYVELNGFAQKLYDKFLPGPITVISKVSEEGAGESIFKTLAPNGTLGIRIPDHALPLQIINALKQGITSTSANESGGVTPYKISDIFDNISDEQKALIDIVIDAGDLPERPASTIIDTTSNPPWILRGEGRGLQIKKGKIGEFEISRVEDLQKVIYEIWKKFPTSANSVCFLLQGELGSGKTTFVQQLGKFLGIKQNMISPSFVLERQYEIDSKNSIAKGFNKLYHYDFWRIEPAEQSDKSASQILEELGVRDALKDAPEVEDSMDGEKQKKIIAIEWPEKIENADKCLALTCDVTISILIRTNRHNQDERTIEVYI